MGTLKLVPPRDGATARGTAPREREDVRGPSRRLAKKRWLRWALWSLALVGLGVGVWRLVLARRAAPIPVQVVTVQRGRVRDFVTSVAAGRVSGLQEAQLRAEIGGTVRTVHRHRGDLVKAGDPLVSYDSSELRERVKSAEAAVGIARAQALQIEQNAVLAEANASRATHLQRAGSISDAEVDALSTQARALARNAEGAKASIRQAESNAELARTTFGKAIVRAPFDGTILSTSIEVGETSLPGTPLLAIADVSVLHVDVDIDEADVGRIAIGMPADVALDAFPGERLHGVVRFISPSVARDSHGGRSLAAEITLPTDSRLRVGMSADVDVIVLVHDDARWLPPNAVLGRGAERAVYVVDRGVVHKRAIDVGIATWEAVEVRSGLVDGDQVVASLSSAKLADGAHVIARAAGAAGAGAGVAK